MSRALLAAPPQIIHVGDFAYDFITDNGRNGDRYMRDMQSIVANTIYMASTGNHEDNIGFNQYNHRFINMPPNAGKLLDLEGNFNITDKDVGWNQVCSAEDGDGSDGGSGGSFLLKGDGSDSFLVKGDGGVSLKGDVRSLKGDRRSLKGDDSPPKNHPLPNSHWFSFKSGLVKWISINTEIYMEYADLFHDNAHVLRKTQWKWLEQELKKANEKEERGARPWVIVYSHHPLYCSSPYDDCDSRATSLRTGVRGDGTGRDLIGLL